MDQVGRYEGQPNPGRGRVSNVTAAFETANPRWKKTDMFYFVIFPYRKDSFNAEFPKQCKNLDKCHADMDPRTIDEATKNKGYLCLLDWLWDACKDGTFSSSEYRDLSSS